MPRNPVTLLLIPTLLLAQSAAAGHFHFDSESDHDDCHHFHLCDWLLFGDDSHDHEGDAAHEDDAHHEVDAIYVAADEIILDSEANAVRLMVAAGWLSSADVPLEAPVGLREPLELWPHPPPGAGAAHLPIYIRLNTLLL